jgi:hypothetical protein
MKRMPVLLAVLLFLLPATTMAQADWETEGMAQANGGAVVLTVEWGFEYGKTTHKLLHETVPPAPAP